MEHVLIRSSVILPENGVLMLIFISVSLLIAEVHLQVTTALALGRLLMAGANGWGGGGKWLGGGANGWGGGGAKVEVVASS